MGQRVVTSLNHIDLKKIKIKIIIMQIKKGNHFFESKKEYTWGGTKKKIGRESRED